MLISAARLLTPDDWPAWRALRLAALRESPHAFRARLADWQGAGDVEPRWRDRLRSVTVNYLVDLDGRPAGMVSGDVLDPATVELLALWVAPAARGCGVGDRLVELIVTWARSRPPTERVVLHVHEPNEPAVALYRRHGFRPTGTGPDEHGERLHELRLVAR